MVSFVSQFIERRRGRWKERPKVAPPEVYMPPRCVGLFNAAPASCWCGVSSLACWSMVPRLLVFGIHDLVRSIVVISGSQSFLTCQLEYDIGA